MRCEKPNCGGRLTAFMSEFGAMSYHCAQCTNRRNRICRDCGGRTPEVRCWRCVACAYACRRAKARVRDRARNLSQSRRRHVAAYNKKRNRDPEFRARKSAYNKAYRLKNPNTEYERRRGREHMRAKRQNPEFRAYEKRLRLARQRKAAA